MKKKYQDIKFRTDTLKVIEQANTIIEEYSRLGYLLTLRQLYYQFVARGLRENTERSYKQLGGIISDGRLAGLIDWSSIQDRTRNVRGLSHWDSPADIMRGAYQGYQIDKWARQPNYIEVWVEKDALVGVVEQPCNEHDVRYFACRGYVSQSEMYDAAQRIIRQLRNDKEVHILHLGDHDPSGIDMTRDIMDRITLFLDYHGYADINRLALNFDQVEVYTPPPNPAKVTDSRFIKYQEEHGDESWELDALEPQVIESLIEEQILSLRDEDLWEEACKEEEHQKELLRKASEHWGDVAKFLERDDETPEA